MRLRSSLRCSKKVIAPAGSSGGVVICVLDSDSGTDSGRGLVVIEGFLGTRDGSPLGAVLGRHCRSGSGFRSFFALGLERLTLHFAHFLFKGALKVCRSFAEFGHELAQAAGELRQLLWPEHDQDHNKDHNHVRNAQHCVWEPSKGSMGIIERLPAAVKPEFTEEMVCYNLRLSCHARYI